MKKTRLSAFCASGWVLLPVLVVVAACAGEKKGFMGSTAPMMVATPVILKDPGAEALAKKQGDTSFTSNIAVATSVNKKEVWGVTYEQIFRVMIDDDNGATPQYPTTIWSIGNNSGSRTFVSEIGLLIGRSNLGEGRAFGLFRVSDDVPGAAQHVWQPDDQAAQSRMCVTSFRVNGKPYVGGAYQAPGNNRIFFRAPIDRTKPTKIDMTKLERFPQGTGLWGYSCYIDQARGVFYATWSAYPIYGVNVVTGQPLPGAPAPNANHTSTIADFAVSPAAAGSYSISGDENGNVLSAKSRVAGIADHHVSYTWSQDIVSKYLFGSTWGEDRFYVTHPDCFSKISDCKGKHFVFPGAKALGTIGPMSSLSDGRVAAWSRSSHHSSSDGLSYLYLISLKDVNNPSQGVNFKKILEVPGETYMYTDFTGATLYAADVETTLELGKGTDFRNNTPITAVKMRWFAQSEKSEKWQGLKLQVRCYAKSSSTKPAYVEVSDVPEAGTEFDLPESCKGNIDSVDVFTTAAGNVSTFSRTKSFTVFGVQNSKAQ
jgi:hypothetical protein